MTLPTLVLLFALAGVLRLMKWQRSSWALFVLSLIALFAAGCGPLPSLMMRDLHAGLTAEGPASWNRNPVIILLGAGTEYDGRRAEVPTFAFGRVTKALELYRSCRESAAHCRVLVSGGDPQHRGASEAAVYGRELVALGVDAGDLILETRSSNTWQNARFSSALLKSSGADQVLLVTSGYHCRRSRLYFSHFGVDALFVRGDYEGAVLTFLPTAYNFTLADAAIHEYLGILRYYIYQWLGLNASAEA